MEKLIYQQITDHIQINNYISYSQYGFLKGRSTNSQLLKIMNKWTLACNDDIQIDCIYLDIQKAFDSVSHKLWIHKLRMYHFSEPIMSWLTSFMSDRKQSIQINGVKSELTPVISGVPQGSIIGPLTFVLFVNDLPSAESDVILFADGTKLWRFIIPLIKDDTDILALQNDTNRIIQWCDK